jgi:hypothetical protein
VYTGNCIESSNLSFTATFSKRKPLIFLEKVGGLWFLASEKRPYGTEMGLEHSFDEEKAPEKLVSKPGDPATSARLSKPLHSRTDPMSDNSESNIATADALTLLLHNQHAISAAIDEVTKWLTENGVEDVALSAVMAMETLDTNAQALTDAIMRLRQS